MRRVLPLMVVVLASCAEPVVTGSLQLEALDDGAALQVTFVPSSPGTMADLYLEFQAVATKIVLQGGTTARNGCIQLPSSGTVVVLTDEARMPPGSSVRVAAWHFEPSGGADPDTIPVRARCAGTMITNAFYATPLPPDAGVTVMDAGVAMDAGQADARPDADVDGGDASGGDAAISDTGTSTTGADAATPTDDAGSDGDATVADLDGAAADGGALDDAAPSSGDAALDGATSSTTADSGVLDGS